MPYSKTTWVSGSTKLGPTNLNHLEDGVAASPYGPDATANQVPISDGADGWLYKAYAGGGLSAVSSGSSVAVDFSTAPTWDIILTDDCTFSFAGFTADEGNYLTLVIRQDGTGSRAVTWPTITWIGTGAEPILQTAAYAVDSVVLFSFDGGATVFGVAQTSASGLRSGSSFPGGPADGDLFYRSDRRIMYEYDNVPARWLSLDRKYVQFGAPLVASSTTAGQIGAIPVFEDIYVESLQVTTRQQDVGDGTKYWTVTLYTETPAIGISALATFNTSADTLNVATLHSVSVGAVVDAATYAAFLLTTAKVSTPGSLILAPLMVVRSAG